MDLSFRPIEDDDLQFLKELYASSRKEELDAAGMPAEQQSIFLGMQFESQHHFYQSQFSNAKFEIILSNSDQIGRRYVDTRSDQIRILDLLLLPMHRGNGIGTHLLEELQKEASAKRLPLTIVLQAAERSHSLFQRLGFAVKEEDGPNYTMEWIPTIT